MCTQNEAMIVLQEVYEGCRAIFGKIEEAYLYGSYARGDFHEESDIDILLTVEQPQSVISHHVLPFYQNVVREGIKYAS